MKPRLYQSKTGQYAGTWHLRLYERINGKTKYTHIGRYTTEQEARAKVAELYVAPRQPEKFSKEWYEAQVAVRYAVR